MRSGGVWIACLALLSSGCGAIAQTIVGWSSEEDPVRREESRPVRISVDPEGAQVMRVDPGGEEVPLGAAPLTDNVRHTVEVRRRSPSVLAVLLGGIVEVGLSAGAFVLARGEEKCFSDGSCYRTKEPNKLYYGLGGGVLALGIADLITAWAHGVSADEVTTTSIGAPERQYLARKDGFFEARRTIDVSKDPHLSITLAAAPLPPEPPKIETPPPASKHANWVVAVMPVQGDTVVQGLSDQLRVFVGQKGCKTIDRTSQERAFEERVREAKLQSYDACYDEACHIELGKALAASHILRAELLRFGARCVLNAELIDLMQEVAIAAASSEGTCEEEGFLNMSEQVATTLLP